MTLANDTNEALATDWGGADVEDYVALLKPRVMSLVVFTALVGMVAAPGALHPALAAIALLAIAVGAGAAGALNMWYDADIDRVMKRTRGAQSPPGASSPTRRSPSALCSPPFPSPCWAWPRTGSLPGCSPSRSSSILSSTRCG